MEEQVSRRERAIVFVIGDARIAKELAQLLPARLNDSSLDLELVPRPAPAALEGLLARPELRFLVELDVSEGASWELVIIVPDADRAPTRTLTGNGSDAAALEAAIAVIVSANEALVAGESLGGASVEQVLSRRRSHPAGAGRPGAQAPVAAPNRAVTKAHAASPGLSAAAPSWQLALTWTGEPLTVPAESGGHLALTAAFQLARLQLYGGASGFAGVPTSVATPLGESEFRTLQVGAQVGVLVSAAEWLELGGFLEPFGEYRRVEHYSLVPGAVGRETPTGWHLCGRAGFEAWFWPMSGLAVGGSSGMMLRNSTTAFVDSRGQTLFSSPQASWFYRVGFLIRLK